MLEYKGDKRWQVAEMFGAMATPEELTDWVLSWGKTWGVNGQIGLVNTLYRISQQRGFVVGGTTTLGEQISVEQNHRKFLLSEKQAEAIVRDVWLFREVDGS
jgi:hypothetical protein